MTGVTLTLEPWQADELRKIRDTNALGIRREEISSANLIRRGLVQPIGRSGGVNIYTITDLGRAALERYDAGEGLADRPYDDDSAGDPEHNRSVDYFELADYRRKYAKENPE